MDAQFLTQWFGGGGAVFAVIFGLFKAIWPEIKVQLEIKSEQKKKENDLRAAEQQLTREMIEQVKVTNGLVAKNNEAFSNHNTIFGLHVEAIKELKEHQKGLKSDMHKRFDLVEDKLGEHHANAVKIESEQSEIVAGLRSMYGIGKTKEAQQ
ncbi:hypothetical protein DSECCO2_449650 [anaerobic digester metagenome]